LLLLSCTPRSAFLWGRARYTNGVAGGRVNFVLPDWNYTRRPNTGRNSERPMLLTAFQKPHMVYSTEGPAKSLPDGICFPQKPITIGTRESRKTWN
jgi:hypothetical protein